jgi:hypothetical protein
VDNRNAEKARSFREIASSPWSIFRGKWPLEAEKDDRPHPVTREDLRGVVRGKEDVGKEKPDRRVRPQRYA